MIISNNGATKKCLIGLFGLPRTFKYTSKLLFERLIDPNKNSYEFDIIINTDFNNSCNGCGRPDADKGISKYKYESIEVLNSDLYESYNKYNQLKNIIIYNYDNTSPIFPWILVYKRIHDILINAYENKKKYDLYIMFRIDTILDNILNLDNITNELLLISADWTRNAFLHNRDLDMIICGNYKPFMYWILSMINLFNSLISKQGLQGFFSGKEFVDKTIVDLFNTIKLQFINEETSNIDNSCYNEIIKQIQIKHTHGSGVSDTYYINNASVGIDWCNVFDISEQKFFEWLLDCIRVVMYTGSSFILSENKHPTIHCTLIR